MSVKMWATFLVVSGKSGEVFDLSFEPGHISFCFQVFTSHNSVLNDSALLIN